MGLASSINTAVSRSNKIDVVHLPGLNVLRFYAAISVVIAHTSNNFGDLRTSPAHITLINALAMDAQSAVSLFFVLSGFLITYLLLIERANSGTLSIKKFYTRRLLRIWPLYYLTVVIGFVAIPAILGTRVMFNITPLQPIGTALVLLIMANFVTGLGPIGHLWSIGLEEQFYLAWPWVVKHSDNILPTAFGVIIVKLLVYPAVAIINVDSITNLYLGLRFECMAIGALLAYVYHHQHWVLRVIYSLPAMLIILMGVIYLALVDIPFSEFNILTTSFLFAFLIINLATNPAIAPHLKIPLLDTLGKMSYGIYMFHYPLLYVLLFIFKRWGMTEGLILKLILYLCTIGGTLILAFISYRWYETPFLKLKNRYAMVKTRS